MEHVGREKPSSLMVLILAWVSCLGFANAANGYTLKELVEQRLDPALEYRTIETEHWLIHYPTQLHRVANDIAEASERIHGRVTRWLGVGTSSHTHIVLHDKSDQPSVFAFVHPHAQIYFDVSLPHMGMGLNEYGDWHEWLLTHEYTHIVQMSYRKGSQNWTRFLGAWANPNRVSPRWLKEGLAVRAETELTAYGRGSGSFYPAMVRTVLDAGQLGQGKPISKENFHNERYKKWPWPDRGYVVGELLVRELLEDSRSDCLVNGLASSPPLYLRKAFNSCGFDDFDALWAKAIERAQARAVATLVEVRNSPVSKFEMLTDDGFWYAGLTLSSDDLSLIATRDSPDAGKQLLELRNIEGDWSNTRVVAPRTTGYQSSVSRSGRFVVFDQSFWNPGNYLISDLSIFDLKQDAYVSQSSGLRARDVTIHPDGHQLAYVRNVLGRNVLETSNTGFGQRRVLLDDPGYRRISSPAYSPDGTLIALVIHDGHSGAENIWLLRPATGERQILVANNARNRDPHWSADGYTLYYASDQSGIYNAYAVDLRTGTNYRVTNVEGGLLWPNVDNNEEWLYGVVLDDQGYNIGRTFLDRRTWRVVASLPKAVNGLPKDGTSLPRHAESTQAYRPWGYMAPQYLQPHFSFRPESVQVGLRTAAVDPLFFQHYEVAVRKDIDTGEFVGEAFYFDGRRSTALDAHLRRAVWRINANDQEKDAIFAEVNANIFLNNRNSAYFRPGINFRDVDFVDTESHVGLKLGLRYDTEFTQIGYSFPESGKFIDMALVFNNGLSGAENYWSFKGHARSHWALRRPRHAIHLAFDVGWLSTENENHQYGVGGEARFPYYQPSDFEFVGLRPNEFLATKIVAAGMQYTFPIADIQKSWRSLHLTAGRLSVSVRAQHALLDAPDTVFSTDSTSGVGLELVQDIDFADQLELRLKLGAYRNTNDIEGDSRFVLNLVGIPFIRSDARP